MLLDGLKSRRQRVSSKNFCQLSASPWITSWPGDASGKVLLFTTSLCGEFDVALEIFASVLEVTKPLSVRLQEVAQDIYNASENVCGCIAVLQQMRADKTFKKTFEVAQPQYVEAIEMPRENARQGIRDNDSADSAKEYNRH